MAHAIDERLREAGLGVGRVPGVHGQNRRAPLAVAGVEDFVLVPRGDFVALVIGGVAARGLGIAQIEDRCGGEGLEQRSYRADATEGDRSVDGAA